VTALALHSFRIEAMAADGDYYTLQLTKISNFGTLQNDDSWGSGQPGAGDSCAVAIQTAQFTAKDSKGADIARTLTLYVVLSMTPRGKRLDKKFSWSFDGTLIGAYLWEETAQQERKRYGGTNKPKATVTATLKADNTTEWKTTTTPNPDTAQADGFTITIQGIEKGFKLTGAFSGKVTYPVDHIVTNPDGTTTTSTENVELSPDGQISATESVEITLTPVKQD
jgi:hypothetical protein